MDEEFNAIEQAISDRFLQNIAQEASDAHECILRYRSEMKNYWGLTAPITPIKPPEVTEAHQGGSSSSTFTTRMCDGLDKLADALRPLTIPGSDDTLDHTQRLFDLMWTDV